MSFENTVKSMEAITDVDVTLVCPTRCGQGGSEACTGEVEGEFHNDLITMLQGMGVEDVVSVGWGGGSEVAMEWAGEVNRTEVWGGGGLKLRGVGVMDPQEKGDGGRLWRVGKNCVRTDGCQAYLRSVSSSRA